MVLYQNQNDTFEALLQVKKKKKLYGLRNKKVKKRKPLTI